MEVACAKCLARKAARLRDAASRLSEESLSTAAVRLEMRYARHPCPHLANAVALHYLLLAAHPQVLERSDARKRYRQQATAWIQRAHRRREPRPSAAASRSAYLDS